MTLIEDAGTEDVRRPCARSSSRYLAFVSHAFNRAHRDASGTSCRTRDSWLEEQRLRGQPRPRAVGARHRRRALGRSGAPQPRRPAVPCRAAGGRRRSRSPRAWAFTLLGIDEYLRAFEGDTRRAGGAAKRSPSGCSTSSAAPSGPTGRGSRTRVTYCNARLPQALHRHRHRGLETRTMIADRPALARMADDDPADRRTGTSRRSASNGFYRARR